MNIGHESENKFDYLMMINQYLSLTLVKKLIWATNMKINTHT
jgi:hypothetical protein